MKIAVTGARGRLGSELVRRGCIPLDCDVSSVPRVSDAIWSEEPDILINCASITDVDACEGHLFQQSSVVNSFGAFNLRQHFDGLMIQMSTDYVFDGQKGPYSEFADPFPINRYGYTKWYAEELLKESSKPTIIVRTTILYGDEGKPDFVSSILDTLDEGEQFHVTTTLKGNPTYVPHLAEALLKLCAMEAPSSVINLVGDDVISRYKFALMIAKVFDKDKSLINPTRRMAGAAQRPRRAGLKTKSAKTWGLPIYSVLDGLLEMRDG